MVQQVTDNPLARFIVIQVVIFVIVAMICLIANFSYSIALSMVGAIIVSLSFLGWKKPEQSEYSSVMIRMVNNLVVIGGVPLATGIALAFI